MGWEWVELGGEELGVRGRDPEGHQGAGVAERTAALMPSESCSVYWLARQKWVANLRASLKSEAKASVLKD